VRSIVIGTAGHIDHGKSALVRALTGIDPDRLKEEQERGITIDLGFAHLEVEGVNLAFVDVPGHERFVKNMLAGAGGTDLVMLVVAADESVMPQTREHFDICRLLRVPAGVIALTKTDTVDSETVDLATLEIRDLVKGSFLSDASIVPVSSRTGEGLDRLRATLVSIARHLPERGSDGPVRLPIDRVFSMKGFGTIVTGTLVSGTIREDQELVVLPRERDVKVRGLQVHGRPDPSAAAGRRVAVNLAGVDAGDLARGDTLCERGAFEPTRRVDVTLDLLPGAPPVRHGARVRVHSGTSELLGRVAVAGARDAGPGGPQPATEPGAAPDALPGAIYARLRLESPAVVTRGDRFIIRAYSPLATVGGGMIVDPHPPRGAIRTEAGMRRFRQLDPSSGEDLALTRFIEERGVAGLHSDELTRRAGLARIAAARTVQRLVGSGAAATVGDLLVAPDALSDLADRLVRELQAHHAAHPLSDGMPREEARERIFRRAPQPVFDLVLERLVSAGKIVARERLALRGHQVSLTPEEATAQASVERLFRAAKLTPPDLGSAAATTGASPATLERVIALLLRSRTLVKVDTILFHADALDELKAEVRSLKLEAGSARVDVASFKARYGITRKYAIPLLEYLDRERVTRRVGEARIVL
jgi:selenocysteine-specific elongation factor